jgi:dTDP-glucose 4,6-dehydratase
VDKLKVFVTGGAGFIGSNFVRNLLNGRYLNDSDLELVTVFDVLGRGGLKSNLAEVFKTRKFRFIEGDILDLNKLKSEMEGHDLVFNFAAESHVDRSIMDPYHFLQTNILGTQNVLQAAHQNNVSKTIHVSTDEVHGSISEGTFNEESPLKPNSPYAASKASAELVVRSYQQTFGIEVCITRCTNNYGRNQFPEKIIPLFTTNLLRGKKIPIYGEGLNVRDWLHVDDHCDALWLVATKGKSGEIYNIGGGKEISNLDLANFILECLDKTQAEIIYVEDRKGHDFRYALDYSKITNELGYVPNVNFELGLRKTIDWYRANQDWWENLRA